MAEFVFMPALPEIVLAVGALALLMVGVFAKERSAPGLVTWLSVVLLAVVFAVLVVAPATGPAFNGAFVLDPFAHLLKGAIIIGSGAAIVMSANYMRRENIERFEFPILILIATIGMMLMVSANDLISLYLGLEMQSLALYVIAAINRESLNSTEAGLKYFVLGALSSGMLLYGASLIYGFTGQTTFDGIARAVAGGSSLGFIFGLVFIIAGIAFKISAVPFHMWTPDVYEGAPTPVTAFFAAAPKVAAMGMLIRAMVGPFGEVTHDWQQILTFVAIASMVLGAFAAIGQRNIKRLMAYSSIGHMGYALVGLAAGTQAGVQGVIVYMLVYMVMTLGTFSLVLAMRRNRQQLENIDDLAGVYRTNPMFAFLFAMLLFSLAGIPWLAGFFAKFYVFLAAIEAGLYVLSVIGVLASVVGAYYYLRIVKIMFFDEPAGALEPMSVELRIILGVSSVLVFFFFVFAGQVADIAETAAMTFF